MTLVKKIILLLIVLSAGSAGSASAYNGWYASPGVTIGLRESSPVTGMEFSMARIGSGFFYMGVFTETSYIGKTNACSVVAGPQFGWLILGVDGGPVYLYEKKKSYCGYSVRPYVTIPYFVSLDIYFRRSGIKRASGYDLSDEWGIQIKYHIPLGNK